MNYIHVDFLDNSFRVVSIWAVPAKYAGLFLRIHGYYTMNLSDLANIPEAFRVR